MNKYKRKTAIRDFIHAGLIIYTFYVVYYLLFIPGKTTEQIIFICVFIGLVAWISTLLREKRKLQIDLLLSLRADLFHLKKPPSLKVVMAKWFYRKENMY